MSFIYDLFWLFLSSSEYSKEETAADGGVEKSIRKFALAISFVNILFRVSYAKG